MMGDDNGYKYERPAHDVTIDYPFALGKYEITFDEWEACAQELGCKPAPDDHGWGKGRYPIINLTYKDIGDYLAWLSKKTGQTYRLPSEAEWEYAARAGTTTAYWWGINLVKTMPIAVNVGQNGPVMARPLLAHLMQTLGAFMICMATHGNGWRIAGPHIMRWLQQMGRPVWMEIVKNL